MIYLDNPATTHKKPLSVSASMFYNTLVNSVNAGHGAHRCSLKGVRIIASAQDETAELMNIDFPERIVFCQNASLALNMAIGGILSGGGHAIVTSMEHNSVLRPVHSFGNYTMVYADGEGYVDPDMIEAVIGEDTKMIICTHASNVSGSIQPIAKIGEIAKKYGILFLVDAAQTAGSVEIDVKQMHADMIAFSGHKGLMSPLGTGGLYVGENVRLLPIISGGTGSDSKNLNQPENLPDMLQVGTMNTPAIAALAAGIKKVKRIGTKRILEHERELASMTIDALDKIDGVRVLGGRDMNKRNGTVSFVVDSYASGEVSRILDAEYNIETRGGWHCAYYAHQTLGSEEAGAVRVGYGWYNTRRDAKRLIKAVKKIAQKR